MAVAPAAVVRGQRGRDQTFFVALVLVLALALALALALVRALVSRRFVMCLGARARAGARARHGLLSDGCERDEVLRAADEDSGVG